MDPVNVRGISDGSHSGMCLGGTRFEFRLRIEYPNWAQIVYLFTLATTLQHELMTFYLLICVS